jgi:hypothetical protein
MLGIYLNKILFIKMPINGNQLAFRLLCAIIQAHLASTVPHRCTRKPETDAIETDDLYSPKYGIKNNNFYGFLDIDFDLIFPPVRARARVTGSKPRADHAVAPEGVFLRGSVPQAGFAGMTLAGACVYSRHHCELCD